MLRASVCSLLFCLLAGAAVSHAAPPRPSLGLSHPGGVALGGQGNVFVADSGNYRILKLTPDGGLLNKWGTRGSGPNQFGKGRLSYEHGPQSLAVDHQGNIYVADTGNARIEKFSPAGTYLASWAVAVQGFYLEEMAVTVDRTNTVVLALAGAIPCTIPPDQTDVSFCPSLYVIQRRDTNGVVLSQWPSALPNPTPRNGAISYDTVSVVADSAGNVYVVTGGVDECYKSCPTISTLDKLGPDGSRLASIGDRVCSGDGWKGVAVGARGSIFLTGAFCNRAWAVFKLTPKLTLISRWTAGGPGIPRSISPGGLAVSKNGTVYVADSNLSMIRLLSYKGKPLATWH